MTNDDVLDPRASARADAKGAPGGERDAGKSTRFRPGRSGNPRGRPKRARSLAHLLAQALEKKITAKSDGKRSRISKLEAAVTQLSNQAAGGDQRAIQFVFKMLQDEQGRPKPPEAERIGAGDALVLAELVRRLSEPTRIEVSADPAPSAKEPS